MKKHSKLSWDGRIFTVGEFSYEFNLPSSDWELRARKISSASGEALLGYRLQYKVKPGLKNIGIYQKQKKVYIFSTDSVAITKAISNIYQVRTDSKYIDFLVQSNGELKITAHA